MLVAALALCAGSHGDASSLAVFVASNPAAFAHEARGARAAGSWLSRLSTATRAQVRRDTVRVGWAPSPVLAGAPVGITTGLSADGGSVAPLCLDRPWLLSLPPPLA